MLILVTILWIIYAVFEGFREAHYYDLYPHHKNIHWSYATQRGIVLLGAFGSLTLPYLESAGVCLGLAFIFSFFHNGAYYMTRHSLDEDVYNKGFWDDSEGSTALIELNLKWRTALAIIGFLLIIQTYRGI